MHGLPSFTMLSLFILRLKALIKSKRFKSPIAFSHLYQPTEQFIPPGTETNVYNGFVSASNNENGLRVKFYHDKNAGVSCKWLTEKKYEGYPTALHGGISFAILDELAAYAVFEKYKTYSVTVVSNARWLGKVKIGQEIYARAQVKKKFWRFVDVDAFIFNNKARLLVKVRNTYYIPSRTEFKRLIDMSLMPKESLPYCGLN